MVSVSEEATSRRHATWKDTTGGGAETRVVMNCFSRRIGEVAGADRIALSFGVRVLIASMVSGGSLILGGLAGERFCAGGGIEGLGLVLGTKESVAGGGTMTCDVVVDILIITMVDCTRRGKVDQNTITNMVGRECVATVKTCPRLHVNETGGMFCRVNDVVKTNSNYSNKLQYKHKFLEVADVHVPRLIIVGSW